MIKYEFVPVWVVAFAVIMLTVFSAAMLLNFFLSISFYKVYVVATLMAAIGSYYVHKYWQ